MEREMFVKVQRRGQHITGLQVGREDARRYFSRSEPGIEIELDHLRIHCGLPPGFWRGGTAIRDQRLCMWLQAKHHGSRSSQKPLMLWMAPAGENLFRLEPLPSGPNAGAQRVH